MTALLTWRNPEHVYFDNKLKQVFKVISTEVGLGVITALSAIETVAYGALALCSLALYPLTDKPCKFFAKLLQSSSFTIIWAIFDALIFNPFSRDILTHESLARREAQQINPTPIRLVRAEDRAFYHRMFPEGGVFFYYAPRERDAGIVQEGAQFLQQFVLDGVSPDFLEKFKIPDPATYPFVTTMAIYIYVAGDRSGRGYELPQFFTEETRESIQLFRADLNEGLPAEVLSKKAALRELTQVLRQDAVEQNQEMDRLAKQYGQPIFDLFQRLRKTAAGELDRGFFVKECWQRAIQLLGHS